MGAYQVIINGLDKIEVLFLPVLGVVCYFFIKLLANGLTENLISRIEKMLEIEQIKFKKF